MRVSANSVISSAADTAPIPIRIDRSTPITATRESVIVCRVYRNTFVLDGYANRVDLVALNGLLSPSAALGRSECRRAGVLLAGPHRCRSVFVGTRRRRDVRGRFLHLPSDPAALVPPRWNSASRVRPMPRSLRGRRIRKRHCRVSPLVHERRTRPDTRGSLEMDGDCRGPDHRNPVSYTHL